MSVQSLIQDTSLTGRNVTLIQTSFNAVAITDTTGHFSATLANSVTAPYKELFITMECLLDNATHNVNPVLKLFDNGAGFGANTSSVVNTTDYAGSTQVFTSTDLKPLGTPGVWGVEIEIACANAPTTGSVTVKLYGISN